MKRLFYLSGTLFFLSLTLLLGVHIGQQTATAEPQQKVIAFSANDSGTTTWLWVYLANGDVYKFRADLLQTPGGGYQPELIGNYWQ